MTQNRREAQVRYQRAYVARNPERCRELRRASRAQLKPWTTRAHKATGFAYRSNQRAARLGVPGRLTATDVRAIDGPCAYCGGPAMGWDHVTPMAKGGVNAVVNLVSCCRSCNGRKGCRSPQEAGLVLRSVA